MKPVIQITSSLALVISLAGCTPGCNKDVDHEASPETSTAATTEDTTAASTDSALKIEDTKVGEGKEAENGKVVTVHYTGTLTDGTKFDSSHDRDEPFSFSLGSGQVIKGWEKGIQGMKVGGKRKLTIPPEMAYGANAVGAIPANSTLVFDVELLDVD